MSSHCHLCTLGLMARKDTEDVTERDIHFRVDTNEHQRKQAEDKLGSWMLEETSNDKSSKKRKTKFTFENG